MLLQTERVAPSGGLHVQSSKGYVQIRATVIPWLMGVTR